MDQELTELILQVLNEYSNDILPQETIQNLLKTDTMENEHGCLLKATGCYPKYPLYEQVAQTLISWMVHGKNVCDRLTFDMLDDNISCEKAKNTDIVDQKLKHLYENWDVFVSAEKKCVLIDILEQLNVRGILDLLGLSHTIDSVEIFPPPISVLLASFQQIHNAHSNLTTGARALSKHCHRDLTSKWWGDCTGNDQHKNDHALSVLLKILGDASWVNIHMFSHDIKILEIRNDLGYGARWLHDGTMFRGFIEPQMKDGHSKKWRH